MKLLKKQLVISLGLAEKVEQLEKTNNRLNKELCVAKVRVHALLKDNDDRLIRKLKEAVESDINNERDEEK